MPTIASGQDRAITEQQADVREAIVEPDCLQDPFQPDVITVCGEATEEETRRHMSVLPRPVQSDRDLVGGLRTQPCWIARTPGVFCARGGFRPPQVVLIDLSAIPVALTPEEEALVFRAEDLPPPAAAPPEATIPPPD